MHVEMMYSEIQIVCFDVLLIYNYFRIMEK